MEDQYESNKKKLFKCAMKGEWDKVIEMYQDDVRIHNARITRSGQTALHIAVSDGKEHVVKQMLHVMSLTQPNEEELLEALRAPNQRKNTALHLAASMGNATICHIMASVEPTLVDDRNNDGETPLFLAALHGRKQAFLVFIASETLTSLLLLPSMITVEGTMATPSFTALSTVTTLIIHLYKELAFWVNEDGLSPLHLLASKPLAFRSGSRLGWMETIIYHCVHVEKLKAENPAYEDHMTGQNSTKGTDGNGCPHSYNTLSDVFRRLIKKVVVTVVRKPAEADAEDPGVGGSRADGSPANSSFPTNYKTCCSLIKSFFLVNLGKGSEELRKIYRKKETHTWSVQIVKELLQCASLYEYEDDGRNPRKDEGYNTTSSLDTTLATSVKPGSTKVKENEQLTKITTKGTPILVATKNSVSMETIEKIVELLAIDKEDEQLPKRRTVETPILMAAKNGVMEIIEKIVELLPVAIFDMNEDKKNIVLLAAEHRQPHVYEFLLKKNIYKESLFRQLDKDGNTALHLAAALPDHMPALIPGEALQMQWELKWFNFVKEAMPPDLFARYNNQNETPGVVFTKNHSDLVIRGGAWLNKASESSSVVAALVVTVAFAAAATVPGGIDQDSGYPTLEKEKAFNVFAASSLIALCCSVMAVVTFLSLLTSRFQEQDFHKRLPTKLILGLTLLLMSIVSMLVSFCAGHYFVLKHQLHHASFTLYALICLAVIFYVLSQFPFYFDHLRATYVRVPQRGYLATN